VVKSESCDGGNLMHSDAPKTRKTSPLLSIHHLVSHEVVKNMVRKIIYFGSSVFSTVVNQRRHV